MARLRFAAAAWQCAARAEGVGWDFRHHDERRQPMANNGRCPILPARHYPNPASRVLSLCERPRVGDWQARLAPPRRFPGTIYRQLAG